MHWIVLEILDLSRCQIEMKKKIWYYNEQVDLA